MKAITYKTQFNPVISNELLFFLDILKESPNHDEALSQLADISAKWKEIGLALKVSRNELDGLQRDHSSIIKLSEVITLWIESESSPVSWETLITAIEGGIVKNKKKAKEIRDYLYSQH